ncbi:hypothetical protein ACHAPE_005195 [Trichoderma viride]
MVIEKLGEQWAPENVFKDWDTTEKDVGIDVFSTQHPQVLRDLQRSTARILEMAKRVDGFQQVSRNYSDQPPNEAEETELRTPTSEIASPELLSSLSSNRQSDPEDCTTIEVDPLPNAPILQTVGLVEAGGINQRSMSDWWLPTSIRGTLEFQSQPQYQPPSLQCEQLMRKLDCFASKVVQATLSQAYSVLFASEWVLSEDVYRIFGSTLRIRSREKILWDLRWLLGPGKTSLPHASGYLWKHASKNGMPRQQWAGSSLLDEICLEVESDAELTYQPSVCQPRLLTVLGVVQELARLEARVVDNDTMEITLSEQRPLQSVQSRIPLDGAVDDPFIPISDSNHRDFSGEVLKLRLSVPRLTRNLALAGTCSKIGPVYARNDIAKAVEAAIIIVGNDL